MATALHRIGRFSLAHRRLVIALWMAVLAAVVASAVSFGGSTTNSITVPGTQSQEAIDELQQDFPESHVGSAQARVVFQAPEGHRVTERPYAQAIREAVDELGRGHDVAAATDPFDRAAPGVSKNGLVALSQVQYEVASAELEEPDREAVHDAAGIAERAGLTVKAGGDAMSAPPEVGSTEVIGVVVALIVLIITFTSLVAAGMNLLIALISVGISYTAILALTGSVELTFTAPILALMLGLAVSIDYTLFIVSRHRHELADGRTVQEAAARAVGTAGSAVVFAGATVIIALCGLAVTGMPMLIAMGLCAAGAVAIAVLVSLTLVPALLGVVGNRVTARAVQRRPDGAEEGGERSMGRVWARLVTRRPRTFILVALAVIGVLAVPVKDFDTALPSDGTRPVGTELRDSYDLISDHFGPGLNGQLVVAVQGDGAGAAARAVAKEAAGLTSVAAVTEPVANRAGDVALLTVVPGTGPTSAATQDLVQDIRDRSEGWTGKSGAEVKVTGVTALSLDTDDKLGAALPPYLLLIMGLSLILLVMVFRSVTVALKAAFGFLLSVAATFGATVAVFQWGWLSEVFGIEQTAPLFSILPILLIGVLFGLAMDYEVFLVSRMREEHVHGRPPKEAVVNGFAYSARVVTAAAIIMIAVFAGFVFSHDNTIKSLGFCLAFGVLIDAFVVRMTVVPAVMALLGRAAWWLPRALDRVLPRLDVEGESLDRTPARTAEPVP
ncbi:MMPL family transporter [Streptomyces sp. NPDC052023]|uniref:MMPL family transporter n=1 Tax=Streptomyces sp. NPDC052023 TaxID=3365681 RepID=UPI0037D04D31